MHLEKYGHTCTHQENTFLTFCFAETLERDIRIQRLEVHIWCRVMGTSFDKCSILTEIHSKLDKLCKFATDTTHLANCHMTDFIIDGHFEKLLPINIRSEILTLSSKELALIPSAQFSENLSSQCPELSEFLLCAKSLRLENLLHDSPILQNSAENIFPAIVPDKICIKDHMTDKKSHEVEELSWLVARAAHWSNVSHVVDIGSGRGFLGTFLSVYYGLKVIGIDFSNQNTHAAAKRQKRTEKNWKGILKKEIETLGHQSGSYEAVTSKITSDTNVENFLSGCDRGKTGFLLSGLHACGDLTAYGLKMFLESPGARSCCFVSCCYHQIRESYAQEDLSQDSTCFYGFPLSSCLRDRKFFLGKNARMLGLQSVDRISKDCSVPNRTLYWRVLFQKILLDKGELRPDLEFLGRLGKRSKDFSDYFHRATEKLHLNWNVSKEEIFEYEQEFEQSRIELNAFGQLRYCLSPVIEAIITLDRVAFLIEQVNYQKRGHS